jgi:multidrug efflux pump subunit AcrB
MTVYTSQGKVAKKESAKLTFMQRFGLFFYDRRETTLLFALVLAVFGALSYTTLMQRQGFPGVDVPVSTVSGAYFAGNKQVVDRDVTKPASDALVKLPEVDSVAAQASDTFFMLIVQYKDGVSSQQGNALTQRTLQGKGVLPPAVQADYKPINATKFADEYDVLVSVYSTEQSTPEQLTTAASDMAIELQRRPGIARATPLRLFETGTDPLTGKLVSQQQHFDRFGERADSAFRTYPSATIGIVGRADGDALKLSEQVLNALPDVEKLPSVQGYKLAVSADVAEDISDQIHGLQRSLLEGLAVVLLICFALISWRASLTAALSMLTVMLVTLGILYVTGNSLNTITLFALILSLGLIVDDTIIKVDAIDAAKGESRRKRRIVALAARRVSRASVAGTVTTMLAFAPMLFVSGTLGDFIRIMPITVIVSLAMSLLVSLILVPILASGIILRKQPRPTRNPLLKVESAVSNGLARMVQIGRRSRPRGVAIGMLALGIAFAMIVASFPLFQKLQFNIFPATKDTNKLQVALSFGPTTTIDQAEAATDDANARIERTLGQNLRRLSYQTTGSTMRAVASVDLTSFKDRAATSPQLVDRLESAFADYRLARVQIAQVDVGPPVEELPFKAQIFSETDAQAQALAKDMAAYLQGRTIKRANGATARITRAEVANPTQVVREDGRRLVEVWAGFDATDTSALVSATQKVVEEKFPQSAVAGYGLNQDALKFDFGAETENQESFSTLVIAFPILVAIMYLLMALQFRSWLQPLLIFLAIPFSFFGVALGLYVSDNPLSFFVMIGFFALIGIALNNAILLTDYANQARADGKGRVDAVAYAIRVRLRPLVTTSLTSVVALVPLALSDPFWESLSLTLICGLLSSTFLVVVAFPYIYLGGEVLRTFGHLWWTRKLPAALQYPLDLLIAPLRLAAFVLHIIFRL